MSATSLCPDIKELVIEDQGRDCAEALTRMKVCNIIILPFSSSLCWDTPATIVLRPLIYRVYFWKNLDLA